MARALTIVVAVIISLIILWFAGGQCAGDETQAGEPRRDAMLEAISAELRWNRTATQGILDADNGYVMVGTLGMVAF